ncbi:MAG: FAD-dependent oxidoreductase [Pirellulaceae bacterium]
MIRREPEQAASRAHDLIVIGGGIYGVAMTLEAARRGLRVVLVERDDFGGATSWNSLRILHGGLRYLQTLDLPRFFESVGERRWFCRHFPELVATLPCLMPLYGRGMKRPSVFRVALKMNDTLSFRRNAGVAAELHLPGGRVLSAQQTLDRYPAAPRDGLQGGGLWYDVVMPNSQRVLIEMLHWACAAGAIALNYVSAEELRVQHGAVQGVEALDRISGKTLRLDAPVVYNCTGPWSRALGVQFDRDLPTLFQPSLAFNVLLDREPLSDAALAAEPPGGPTYFMHPFQGRIFAGTSHWPWSKGAEQPQPTDDQLEHFLKDLNRAAPKLQVTKDHVLRVFPGLLPSRSSGSRELAVREAVHDHGRHDGPRGLFSLSGVKYTTARRVAANALALAWRDRGGLQGYGRVPRPSPSLDVAFNDPLWPLDTPRHQATAALRDLVDQEAVMALDDLLLRRTDWLAHPGQSEPIVAEVRQILNLPAPH